MAGPQGIANGQAMLTMVVDERSGRVESSPGCRSGPVSRTMPHDPALACRRQASWWPSSSWPRPTRRSQRLRTRRRRSSMRRQRQHRRIEGGTRDQCSGRAGSSRTPRRPCSASRTGGTGCRRWPWQIEDEWAKLPSSKKRMTGNGSRRRRRIRI
jgi:hypothetical protein